MRPVPYYPCREAYKNYYIGQVGGGLPVFAGRYHQRGYGFGRIFSLIARSIAPMAKVASRSAGLFGRIARKSAPLIRRSAKPLLKKAAKVAGKELARGGMEAGVEALNDLIKQRSKKRQKRKRIVSDIKLEPPKKRSKAWPQTNKKRRHQDIFDL